MGFAYRIDLSKLAVVAVTESLCALLGIDRRDADAGAVQSRGEFCMVKMVPEPNDPPGMADHLHAWIEANVKVDGDGDAITCVLEDASYDSSGASTSTSMSSQGKLATSALTAWAEAHQTRVSVLRDVFGAVAAADDEDDPGGDVWRVLARSPRTFGDGPCFLFREREQDALCVGAAWTERIVLLRLKDLCAGINREMYKKKIRKSVAASTTAPVVAPAAGAVDDPAPDLVPSSAEDDTATATATAATPDVRGAAIATITRHVFDAVYYVAKHDELDCGPLSMQVVDLHLAPAVQAASRMRWWTIAGLLRAMGLTVRDHLDWKEQVGGHDRE
jgi:hypothetical protein